MKGKFEMNLQLYVIYDKTTCFHHPPMVAHNADHAKRKMMDLLNTPNNMFIRHAGEFELWYIGDFNDHTAMLIPAVNKTLLCNLKKLVNRQVLEDEKHALFDSQGKFQMPQTDETKNQNIKETITDAE